MREQFQPYVHIYMAQTVVCIVNKVHVFWYVMRDASSFVNAS